jgi:alpha-D-xyloside xylohydrolase
MKTAVEAHRTSVPMMRAMLLEFPDDPTCRALDRQYMFGGGLLVAPVFHESRAEYYLPEGEWVHLLTGEVRRGGRWFFDVLGYLDMPVFIRPNAIVPMGEERAKVEYDYAAGVRLVCGRLDGSTPRSVDVVDRHGEPLASFEFFQRGNQVTIINVDDRRDWRVSLPWANLVAELEGGRVETEASRATDPGVSVFGRSGVEIIASSPRVSFVWR